MNDIDSKDKRIINEIEIKKREQGLLTKCIEILSQIHRGVVDVPICLNTAAVGWE